MIFHVTLVTHFLYLKSLSKNKPQKPKNHNKMLRKYAASHAWAVIFKKH